MAEKTRISLALQGGGAHGAFTWGALDRLLEEDWLEIAAISGASAGALNGAALKDVFGNNLNFAKLCMVLILNEDSPNDDGTPSAVNTTNLTVGAGTNQIPNILGSAGATKVLRPGDVFLTANFGASGIATITPGTADELQIVNGVGATCNYQIILAGRSV